MPGEEEGSDGGEESDGGDESEESEGDDEDDDESDGFFIYDVLDERCTPQSTSPDQITSYQNHPAS